jgi:NAD+ synthase (glutamine-hydrolysing)
VGVPRLRVAEPRGNAECILELWRRSHQQGDALVVFPELALCGYTVRDLLLDQHLLGTCEHLLGELAQASANLSPLAILGVPLRVGTGVFNTAAVLQQGRVLAVVPKAYLPSYREFEERRWFRPGTEVAPGATAVIAGHAVPFGLDVLLAAEDQRDLILGIEICEDCWVHAPPSASLVSAGASVIANLSASNFTLGKAELRRLLARSASDRGKCAYLYVSAGPGESSTDLAFDGDAFICENGRVLAQSTRFSREAQLVTCDLDLELLAHERIVTTSFGDCSALHRRAVRTVPFAAGRPAAPLRREVSPHPFLPAEPASLASRCWEIYEVQTHALATRMRALDRPRLVLGVSGGLDSTQAALVCAGALDLEEQPRDDLLCVSMPGLGTSSGTRSHAEELAARLGARFREIAISEATRLVLRDVEHAAATGVTDAAELAARLRREPALGDTTLENVQARLRTLLLMTLANQHQGLVVGTGDLSEKALGWSTYAGDQIAMYDVNAGVPKTLIRFLVRWVANERARTWSSGDPEALRELLFAILDTPISPELLPADESGRIAQLTEVEIGPYELHDFFLYHFARHGARPGRILDLARVAFRERYPLPGLKHWLRVFYARFFAQQYKRSCTADAPKVGMVALSPRSDWRMPSDARPDSWLEEIDRYEADG